MSKMNNHTKQIMRGLRLKIIALEAENEQLKSEAYQADYDYQHAKRCAEESHHEAHMSEERAARARRDVEEIESAAESKRWETRRLTEEVERARSWGDRWGVERGLEKLKRL